MNTVELCKQMLEKFEHSETRVPYTYHHDMLRKHVYPDMGRSEIAQMKEFDEEELYLFSLFCVIEDLGVIDFIGKVSGEEFEKLMDLQFLFKRYMNTYLKV